MDLTLYFNLAIDSMALLAFLWTIWQEFRIHKRVKYEEILNQDDLDEIDLLLTKFEADLKQIKAQNTALKLDVFDYVDQVLRPLHQRLQTRQTRLKQSEEAQEINKKGGIIPFPRSKDGSTS